MTFKHSHTMAKKFLNKRAKPILVISLAISTVFALQAPAAHADLLPQDPLFITSTSGILGAPLVLTYSGGSGAGAHYFQNGGENNCDVTSVNGEWLLTFYVNNKSGLPVCIGVQVVKNGDDTYNSAFSSIDITFTDGHGAKPQLPTVLTSVIDKVGQPLPMTYSSVSALVIARSEKAKSVRQNTP